MNANTVSEPPQEAWENGSAYELYVGRWSRRVARKFLQWLAVPAGSHWLDVGCGTGALSQVILQSAAPGKVKGIDRSESYIAHAREMVQDQRLSFEVGDAQALPAPSACYDAVVSSLMLNFLPQPDRAINEMRRVVKSGGVIAAYVWDYAGGMQFMRHFWDAAIALDPEAVELDEGRRFPLCQPAALTGLFQQVGLQKVEVRPIDIHTDFIDFEDYWKPFLGGQGPAPGYAMSLSEEKRLALRERILLGLTFALDGSIPLTARAWAVRGVCP